MAEERDVKETLDLLERTRIENTVNLQKEFFATGKTKRMDYRLNQLLTLRAGIKAYRLKLLTALEADLGKSAFEAYETEIGMVLEEIRYALKRVKGWGRSRKVATPLIHFPSESRVYKEPLGTVLILSPWNYPVYLCLAPLVSAMAAGNCAVLKPSRRAEATQKVLAEMIRECFDTKYVALVTGEEIVHQELLNQPFDHIFFTGSVAVGKTVMEAAAKQLIPVTLELGGKSPCIVDETAKVDLAARRIVWGKCLNGGQTCVAPDYVLVDQKLRDPLVAAMKRYMEAFYGEKPLKSKDLPKIISQAHYQRLQSLLEGQNVVYGGGGDPEKRKLEPAILIDVEPESPVMQEEIFGPILPVLAYENIEDAISFIKEREKPLALYHFTSSVKLEQKIIREISYGGGCVNDTIVHLANPALGFGGVGKSGMGGYHGKKGFDTFTHEKSVLKKSQVIDIPLRYPPYKGKYTLLSKLLR